MLKLYVLPATDNKSQVLVFAESVELARQEIKKMEENGK